MKRKGVAAGIADGMGICPELVPLAAQGAVLHLQAALVHRVIGPSRLGAISLNLGYWLLFETMLFATLRRATGRGDLAFLGLGLLIATKSRFNFAGDLFDFRLDFAAASLFGIFTCAVVRSRLCQRRWCAIAGLVGGCVVAVRFITAVYLAGVLGVVGVGLVIAWISAREPAHRAINMRRLHGVRVMALALWALAAPVLCLHWASIRSYYFGWHAGPDKYIRAAAMGNTNWRAAVGYYPRSLAEDHLGRTFLIVAGACVVAAGVSRMWHGRREQRTRRDYCIALFVASSVLAPLVVLTVDVDKSPVVGGIMVPGVVWMVVLFCRAIRCQRLVHIAAAVAILAGVWVQCRESRRHRAMFAHRAEVESLLAMYEAIAEECRENGWQSPGVAVDCNVDFLAPTILEVTEFERNHRLLNVRETLTRLGECRPEEVFSGLEQSDFVMLSKKVGARGRKSRFPFDRQMETMRPALIRWCEGHSQELTRVTVFDREVVVYEVLPGEIRAPSNR